MTDLEDFRLKKPVAAKTIPSLAGIVLLRRSKIDGVCLPGLPLPNHVAFCDRWQHGPIVPSACESWILAPHNLVEHVSERHPRARIIPIADPRSVFIDALKHLIHEEYLECSSLLEGESGIDPEADVAASAHIEPGARVDAGARVHAGAVIERNVWVREGAEIGQGAVLGSVGMNAYVGLDGRRRGFPHLGAVLVGTGAQIGAQCVIVRGILSSTEVGSRTIIGNLCNVGHGVKIGDDVWISAGVIVGGHATIKNGATIGLHSAIRDNVRVGENSNIGMGSIVTKHVQAGTSVFGNPARMQRGINVGPKR